LYALIEIVVLCFLLLVACSLPNCNGELLASYALIQTQEIKK